MPTALQYRKRYFELSNMALTYAQNEKNMGVSDEWSLVRTICCISNVGMVKGDQPSLVYVVRVVIPSGLIVS